MHIVVIPSWYSNRKNKVLGSFFKEQAQALKEHGENITICYNEILPIYCYDEFKTIFSKKITFDIEDGLDTYRYKNFNYLLHSSMRFNVFAKRIEKLINRVIADKGKIDVFHFHSCFWAGICAPYIKEKFNIPYVLTEHTGISYASNIKKSYLKYIYDSYNSADRLVSVSNSLKKELGKFVKNDISVIHNFIDGNKFKILKEMHRNLRFTFFTLGFLVRGKGFENLIDSCGYLIDIGYDFVLEIGGDGYLRDELEKKINDKKLHNYVKLLGILSRDEVAFYMNKCDAFILASSYETFGVVYIEALACGKPVIGVKNGGAEDIIIDDVGILVDTNSKENLSKAIVQMILNINKYNYTTIHSYFLNNFEKSIIIDKLKDVYVTCLKD
ncbi:glycosyltransferase [Candidatus Arthromitus sp. SFB-rat-Yit]|uniref:glycosyltransferase n=1 Tax=Candidatus Arthromitus sp. SFB-rat-Yit TaxID=1041504 RepID=UPI000227A17C|nr:glycosyltransferase [Candidatus Arthromitus sp. SFB-rat-Yit]BAK81340.1 glycosyl transferase [Candidatus Arthromitus sp. SFB-rat-Yit]